MDSTKEKTDLDITDMFNDPGNITGTISADYSSDTITLSSLWDSSTYSNTSVIGGGYTNGINYPNTMSVTGGPFTVSNGTGITSPWYNNSVSPKIKLDGKGADIEVNGWSLIDAIKKIEERLNILTPNTELEKEWDQLRELGEQYRALEAKLKEQGDMWEKLKAMPAPVIP